MTPEQEQSEMEKCEKWWREEDRTGDGRIDLIGESAYLSRAEEAHRVMEELKKWIEDKQFHAVETQKIASSEGDMPGTYAIHQVVINLCCQLRDKITELEQSTPDHPRT